MPKFDEEAVKAAKATHGKLFKTVVGDDEFYFRKPTAEEYAVFRKSIYDEEAQSEAVPTLVRDVIVLPAKADYDAMVRERPGLPESIGKQVHKAASGGKAAEAREV
jgi:hypothetical protein